MPSPPTIRPATVPDADGIARVHVDSWRFAYQGLLPQPMLDGLSVERRAGFWRDGVSHPLPRAVTLVAVRGERVVGFCSCGPDRESDAPSTQGEVAAIYVAPDSARQGIGHALMDAAIAHLAREGFAEAILWVLADNRIGKDFYTGYGWRRSGRTRVESFHGVEVTEIGYHLAIDPQP